MVKGTTSIALLGFLFASGCTQKAAPPQPAPPASRAAPSGSPITYSVPFSAEERRDFYHLPEGGEMLPLDIMRALESVRTFKPFMEDLERFRLIPDPEDPDGLPVGMSAKLINGKRAEPRAVFFNCASCHTAQITYRGTVLRVEGAPAHFDMAGFVVELLQSLDSTIANPQRLAAFLQRLPWKPLELGSAQQQLDSTADGLRLVKSKLTYLQRLRVLRPTTPAGYGRLDAFMAARNLLFGEKYAVDVNAPVSLPPIFGLSRLQFYHYDNNTNSILQRNMGEDLGVGAVADMNSGDSTVEVRHLLRLEELVAKLPIPRWPEALFGKLDSARVSRGASLYSKACGACHEVGPDGKFPDRVIELAKIGTDPNRSTTFAKAVGDQPFSTALGAALALVEKRAFTRENMSPAEAARAEPAKIVWRTTAGYAARPVDGIWATAPYLHNGSVPTLYDLLLPADARPKTFMTGAREYDVKKVGYVTEAAAGATFLFDTRQDGNHNSGHVYGTNFSEEERLDLLEYLKSR